MDRGWEGEGREKKREQGREKAEDRREAEPGEGKHRREGNGRDKSPTWSSQDLGSTVNVHKTFNAILKPSVMVSVFSIAVGDGLDFLKRSMCIVND